MSRPSKRARSSNMKRNINIFLLTIYLILGGFLLFLIFRHNILAFRYLNIVAAILVLTVAVISFLLIFFFIKKLRSSPFFY